MNYDTIVIGAGIFGSVIAKTLKSIGQDVLIVDAQLPNSGSKPAACLMKPSWMSSLGNDTVDLSLSLLDELFEVQTIEFKIGGLVPTDVFWVNPQKLLSHAFVKYGKVQKIRKNTSDENYVVDIFNEFHDLNEEYTATNVVIAAGIHTPELFDVQGGLKGQMGSAILFENEHIDKPVINPYAPYRQLVAFNRGDGLWVGDGTAILEQNYTSMHTLRSLDRACNLSGLPSNKARVLTGVRPYTKNKPCYFENPFEGFFIATGGAKNGTIAAGYCAAKIKEILS